MILDTPVLHHYNNKVNGESDEDMYCTVGTFKAKYSL